MSQSFSLADSQSLDDLHVYLSRAGRVEDGAVRLIAAAGVLAVYTAILYPRGLLDSSPDGPRAAHLRADRAGRSRRRRSGAFAARPARAAAGRRSATRAAPVR